MANMKGSKQSDTIHGSIEDDVISGGQGMDWLTGWIGNDDLRGGGGSDTLEGGGGWDTMNGGSGDDYLADFGPAGERDTFVFGEKGNENFGWDTIYGFEYGTDLIVFEGYSGLDMVDRSYVETYTYQDPWRNEYTYSYSNWIFEFDDGSRLTTSFSGIAVLPQEASHYIFA